MLHSPEQTTEVDARGSERAEHGCKSTEESAASARGQKTSWEDDTLSSASESVQPPTTTTMAQVAAMPNGLTNGQNHEMGDATQGSSLRFSTGLILPPPEIKCVSTPSPKVQSS